MRHLTALLLTLAAFSRSAAQHTERDFVIIRDFRFASGEASSWTSDLRRVPSGPSIT